MLTLGLAFLFLVVIGVPVSFSILIATAIYFSFVGEIPFTIFYQKVASPTQNFALLAVPLFILVGNIMSETGIASRLFHFTKYVVGWIAGGLSQISVFMSAILGGVSGSAVADASMQSRLIGPEMERKGYPVAYSANVIAYSSLITGLFPPSISLILFGFVGNVSIGKLFLAGIIPGLLLTVMQMILSWGIAKHYHIKPEIPGLPKFKDVTSSARINIWALLFPVFLLFVIRLGIFTPSEAGAFVVVYALIVGRWIYKELSFNGLKKALKYSATDLGMVMFLIMAAGALGYAITLEQLPDVAGGFISNITNSPYLALTLCLLLVLIFGMILDGTVCVLLLTPIILPILTSFGFDSVHIGVIMITTILVGANTPPVGVCMFTVCSLLGCKTEDFFKSSVPFILTFILFLVLLVIFPSISLVLPSTLME
ncbi:Sialic acid TRAP transporter permease protein SiaT [Marinomonas gallaica]|uniref:TRAP transporter large permease protein n=1 Tax=Marinomonas gallaica TaxID=1806667 RepID=A0A1C3JRV1_9GAMM|nr:TRAP transporter large permease [Marinomonas gallaica]SBT17779.1 Sialic acid TRAP transporter permease protein SiaT [Marinomonas gallaica]SBT20105.1 Sialic acid TRAP transporter permease protein SiaT [Marinomonas gallaica]